MSKKKKGKKEVKGQTGRVLDLQDIATMGTWGEKVFMGPGRLKSH